MKKFKKLLNSVLLTSLVLTLSIPFKSFAEPSDSGTGLIELWWTFPDKYDDGSHRYGSKDDRHTCYWERYLSDDRYNLNVKVLITAQLIS